MRAAEAEWVGYGTRMGRLWRRYGRQWPVSPECSASVPSRCNEPVYRIAQPHSVIFHAVLDSLQSCQRFSSTKRNWICPSMGDFIPAIMQIREGQSILRIRTNRSAKPEHLPDEIKVLRRQRAPIQRQVTALNGRRSAPVDAQGHVEARLPPFEPAAVSCAIEFRAHRHAKHGQRRIAPGCSGSVDPVREKKQAISHVRLEGGG